MARHISFDQLSLMQYHAHGTDVQIGTAPTESPIIHKALLRPTPHPTPTESVPVVAKGHLPSFEGTHCVLLEFKRGLLTCVRVRPSAP
ncbi:hypothetical protein DAEQUDRAFT_734158 [Daedalea quercina L-15889]|uniref:Uncharacterized protein n=1 Tax=Daedalea quercina L-15889 TaxID=1314783 RepID=A0A165KHI2_9APHY|nr:hypothetical protein DAEQUDRAFT_734158 [Daedalea quercina L-15889]